MRFPFVIATVVLVTSVTAVYGQTAAETAEALSKALKADSIPWKIKTITGVGFTTIQLNNWSGGGQDAVAFNGLIVGSADYADGQFSWDNDLDLGYGLAKLGNQVFRKADDRIIIGSKASLKQSELFRYTAFLDFRTQFAPGYAYDKRDPLDTSKFLKLSNLMAPGFLTAAVGGEWTPIPEFKLLIAPLAARATFVVDDDLSRAGAFGVDPGQTVKVNLGGVISAALNWLTFDNVTLKTQLTTFTPYEAPALWVITFENALIMKVNSWLDVTFLTSMFYDDRIAVTRDDGTVGPATQARNILSVNVAYTWQNF